MNKIEFVNSSKRTGETVGGRLRDARISKGYSVEELAIATASQRPKSSQSRTGHPSMLTMSNASRMFSASRLML